ncbi:carboxy terminal-processing peptidase [Gammaproteobacteria bacterium]|nr:carboxy terminal-processing peptidase [Gammaproteobacteria bacterium]
MEKRAFTIVSALNKLLPILVAAALLPAASIVRADAGALKWTETQQEATQRVIKALERRHLREVAIDDDFSGRMFDRFLDKIDPSRLYFLQPEVDAYRLDYADRLDDALEDGDLEAAFTMFNSLRDHVNKRLEWAQVRLDQPFDFEGSEYWETDRSEADWPADESASEALWEKRLKNDWLLASANDESEDEIRNDLHERYSKLQTSWRQRNANDVHQLFLDSATELYDPHTRYLNPADYESFSISLSARLTGIGAELEQDGDYTRIRRLIAGGPAIKSESLNAGDRIVGVAQHDQTMIDVVGDRIGDVVQLIRGPIGTDVSLEIIPHNVADGSTRTITLVRDEIQLQDKVASKEMRTSDSDGESVKVGVIKLPAFYTDFEALERNERPTNLASADIQRLTLELQDEGMDALILDLRGNSGGSLTEAIRITGMFIDDGPVVSVKTLQRKQTANDPFPGAIWYGPMAVLVDRFSASASEIVAGALKDHGRAIIIGETTYGKGTVQELQRVDRFSDTLGRLKLTTQQFYRANGESTQLEGVAPDIAMAFPYPEDREAFGERANDNALPHSYLESALDGREEIYAITPALIELLSDRYQSRSLVSPQLGWIDEQRRLLDDISSRTRLPLSLAEREAEQKQFDDERLRVRNQYRALFDLDPLITLEREDDDDFASNDDDEETDLDDDFILDEAGRILADYAKMLSKKNIARVD